MIDFLCFSTWPWGRPGYIKKSCFFFFLKKEKECIPVNINFHICLCVCVYVQACAYCNACVEVIGQPTEMGSLLPPCRCYTKYLGCVSSASTFAIDLSTNANKYLYRSDIKSNINFTGQDDEIFPIVFSKIQVFMIRSDFFL